MTITPYLAMTAAEMMRADSLPPKLAWMACHFSLYSTGLSNLPQLLPPNSMLIVNDIIPMNRHDPEWIVKQLTECIHQNQCSSVLLDIQRSITRQLYRLMQMLLEALPCPVAATAPLAQEFDCPIFLPPCPPIEPLERHLAPWEGRQLWMEVSRETQTIRITEKEAQISYDSGCLSESTGFCDKERNCHYRIDQTDGTAQFTLWRTEEDLEDFLNKAHELGVTQCVGLYQEQWL